MLRPEGFIVALQGTAKEWLGTFVVAFSSQEIPEIVDAAQCIRMLRPEGFFPALQRAANEWLGPFVVAFGAQEIPEIVDAS
jgi:hypothetical protein